MGAVLEFLRHLFGFCGDTWHPNIFHVLMGGPTLGYVVYRIKNMLSYGERKKDI